MIPLGVLAASREVATGGGGTFSPGDLGANLWAWWDASDSATITHSLGQVSQWDDKSANARHLTQGTSAAQPLT